MSKSFKDSLAHIRSHISLNETEDTWEKICSSIVNLTQLVHTSAATLPQETVVAAREFYRPINSALKSERTRLSGPTIDLISALAAELGTAFEPLLHLFLPTLLLLCARTSKVVSNRSKACILSIIDTTQLVSILPYFVQSISDKSTSLRTMVAEGMLACMNSLNPPDLEKEERTRQIEAFIKMSVRDANADVRKIGKQIFQAYEVLLPSKAESFASPLTPTSKKYLGLSVRPKSVVDQHSNKSHPRPVSQLSRSGSSYARPAEPKPQASQSQVDKKSSQALPSASSTTSTAPFPRTTQPATRAPPPPRPKSAASSNLNSHSRPPSRPDSAADLYAIFPGPAKDEQKPQQQHNFVLVRPNLPISRSESSTTNGRHVRSASATASAPLRPNPLVHSVSAMAATTSGAPQRVPVSAPSLGLSGSSKPTSKLLRVDPSGGRDRVHTGPKKPDLPKLSSEEAQVNAIRPPPNVESRKEKQLPRKPELPKLSRITSEEGKRAESSQPIPQKTVSRQPQTLSKKPSNAPMKSDKVAGSANNGADAPKMASSARTKPLSNTESKTESKALSTTSSRAATVSTSAVSARPPLPRTRALSVSGPATIVPASSTSNPPVTRTRATSSSAASAAIVAAAAVNRARGAASHAPAAAATRAGFKPSKAPSKPIWGGSSSTRTVKNPQSSKGVSGKPREKNPPPKTGGQQKRPSMVPEELEDVSAQSREIEAAVHPGPHEAPGSEAIEDSAEQDFSSPASAEPESDNVLESEAIEEMAEQNPPHQGLDLIDDGVHMDDDEVSRVPDPQSEAEVQEKVEAAPLIDLSEVESELQQTQTVSSSPEEDLGAEQRSASVTPTALSHASDLTQVDASQAPEVNDTPVQIVIGPNTPLAAAQTPVRNPNAGGLGVDFNTPFAGQATPISALLSSIERGFLFTPGTPLSPPDSYLPREGGPAIMPFPLFSNREKPPREVKAEGTVLEKTDGWNRARQALEEVEMN